MNKTTRVRKAIKQLVFIAILLTIQLNPYRTAEAQRRTKPIEDKIPAHKVSEIIRGYETAIKRHDTPPERPHPDSALMKDIERSFSEINPSFVTQNNGIDEKKILDTLGYENMEQVATENGLQGQYREDGTSLTFRTTTVLNALLLEAQIATVAKSISEAENPTEILNLSQHFVGYAKNGQTVDIYFKKPTDRDGDYHLAQFNAMTNKTTFHNKQAAKIYYDQFKTNEIRAASTPEMTLMCIENATGQTYKIYLPQQEEPITISNEQLQKLEKNVPLPSDHPLSIQLNNNEGALVIWSSPFMKLHSELDSVERLAFSIQKTYPNSKVYRDDFDPSRTPENVASLNTFTVDDPRKLVFVIDESGSIRDYNIINNLDSAIRATGALILEYNKNLRRWPYTEGKMVIVITGHSEDEMANFVRELGKKDFFKGNYVLLNSCQTNLTTKLISEINGLYGAVGTLRYEGYITREGVNTFIRAVLGQLTNLTPTTLRKLIADNLGRLKSLWVISYYKNGSKIYEGS